jgi:D-serine deaminase-like pyridoxal phosphate-dependent protein
VTHVRDLETPAVTVDLAIMEANIGRVQALLAGHGVANRPHVKTHKIPAIGRMQMAAGAVGITVQKVGEAEVFRRRCGRRRAPELQRARGGQA